MAYLLASLLAGQNLGSEWVTMIWDANGAIQPGRTTQLTSDFGADGVSGLSWVP